MNSSLTVLSVCFSKDVSLAPSLKLLAAVHLFVLLNSSLTHARTHARTTLGIKSSCKQFKKVQQDTFDSWCKPTNVLQYAKDQHCLDCDHSATQNAMIGSNAIMQNSSSHQIYFSTHM